MIYNMCVSTYGRYSCKYMLFFRFVQFYVAEIHPKGLSGGFVASEFEYLVNAQLSVLGVQFILAVGEYK